MGLWNDLKEAAKRGDEKGKQDIAKKEKEQAELLKRLQEDEVIKLEITINGFEAK